MEGEIHKKPPRFVMLVITGYIQWRNILFILDKYDSYFFFAQYLSC